MQLDVLQEENENILDKVQSFILSLPYKVTFYPPSVVNIFLNLLMQLRHEEDRCEEAEARVKELEKQVLALFYIR